MLRSRNYGVSPADGGEDLVHQDLLDLSLLTLNPPDHTRIRRLAAPAFTPRRMTGYSALVDQAIHRLLDRCERDREFDLMAAFASPLPIAVMTRLLGLPDDPARFRRLGSTIAQALDGIWSLRQAKVLSQADAELRDTFADLLSRRADDPGDDLVSALVAAAGRSRSPSDELAALVRLLLIAGFETTVNAIGNGMRWLLADREQWELLVADPGRAEAVAEEVLRFDPPVQQTVRVAHADVELGGVTIAQESMGASPCSPPPTGTLRSSRIRTASTSPGSPPPSTSPSPAASTTASGRRWPGWNWPRRSGPWPSASRRSG